MISYDLVIPKLNSIGGENTKKMFWSFLWDNSFSDRVWAYPKLLGHKKRLSPNSNNNMRCNFRVHQIFSFTPEMTIVHHVI
jgi:hypothetical protein